MYYAKLFANLSAGGKILRLGEMWSCVFKLRSESKGVEQVGPAKALLSSQHKEAMNIISQCPFTTKDKSEKVLRLLESYQLLMATVNHHISTSHYCWNSSQDSLTSDLIITGSTSQFSINHKVLRHGLPFTVYMMMSLGILMQIWSVYVSNQQLMCFSAASREYVLVECARTNSTSF